MPSSTVQVLSVEYDHLYIPLLAARHMFRRDGTYWILISNLSNLFRRPHERSVEDLEIIYDELLHIKALSHLSTMVKRELASILVFESQVKTGTVCKY